jgi:hypothetical protein
MSSTATLCLHITSNPGGYLSATYGLVWFILWILCKDPDPKDLYGIYKCRRCGQNKTTFELRQLRSADELETVFIECYICRFTWREN